MNDITKLPKWAQEHIKQLGYQRAAAVSELEAFTKAHDTGPIRVQLMTSDKSGGPTTREVRFDAHWLQIEHAGVRMDLTLAEDEIRLSYSPEGRHSGPIYMRPTSFQQMLFKSKLEL